MKRYTKDAKRVCDYLQSIAPYIGCGDDPVGFLIASHAVLSGRNTAYLKARQRIALSAMAADGQAHDMSSGPTASGHRYRTDAQIRAEALYNAMAELDIDDPTKP